MLDEKNQVDACWPSLFLHRNLPLFPKQSVRNESIYIYFLINKKCLASVLKWNVFAKAAIERRFEFVSENT